MMNKRAGLIASIVIFGASAPPVGSGTAQAAGSVEPITNFGANPSGIGMYLYTPTNMTSKPAIVVNVHACHGKGTDVCGASGAFAQQADQHGFLVVCPSAVSSDGCWDVHSTNVLTHDGGGDAAGIISMVQWVIENRNGDADRVFIAGHSSGGMMTNVMLGSYPDVFKAGAAYAGVPFACYAQGPVDSLGWNSNCAQGKVTMTGKDWGDLVRAAFPSFAGARPRIQIWHGTKDDVVYFQNFKEEIKQWTNVLGVSETPTSTENNALQSTWIRTRYADGSGTVWVEAIEETGQPHNLVVDAEAAIHFFGLDVSATPADGGVKDAAGDGRGGAGGGTGAGGQSGGAGGGVGGKGGSGTGGGPAGTGGAPGSGGGSGTGGGGAGAGGGGVGAGGNRDAGPAALGGSGMAGKGGSASSGGAQVGGSSGAGGATVSTGSGGRGVDAAADAAGAVGGTHGPSNSASKSEGCSFAGRRGEHTAMLGIWLLVFAACLSRKRLQARRTSPAPRRP
jgi:poly(hydroxyalkanoate) depolymerase family esterase